jgi:hypothetical protein
VSRPENYRSRAARLRRAAEFLDDPLARRVLDAIIDALDEAAEDLDRSTLRGPLPRHVEG